MGPSATEGLVPVSEGIITGLDGLWYQTEVSHLEDRTPRDALLHFEERRHLITFQDCLLLPGVVFIIILLGASGVGFFSSFPFRKSESNLLKTRVRRGDVRVTSGTPRRLVKEPINALASSDTNSWKVLKLAVKCLFLGRFRV